MLPAPLTTSPLLLAPAPPLPLAPLTQLEPPCDAHDSTARFVPREREALFSRHALTPASTSASVYT